MSTNITKKTLNSLVLSETDKRDILRRKRFGFNHGKSYDHKLPFGGDRFIPTNPMEVTKIDQFSFLGKVLKVGDVLQSIQGYHLYKYEDRPAYVNEKTGEGVRVPDLPFEDGDTVKISYYTKNPAFNKATQQSKEGGSSEFIFKETVVVFNWLYDIGDFPHVMDMVKTVHVFGLAERVKEKLFNQDHAVEKVFKSIKINAAGLKEESKPIGSYLLTGPTGTGKTELAKLFSQEMDYPLVRVDMSEFMHEHMVSRFIGSPQGYVGYNDKSFLEQEIGDDKKKMVLLLDEMEKAHYNIQKIFLQAMDNARITLANNKVVDFSNVLILMTSNCGVLQKDSIGLSLGTTSKVLTVDQEKLKQAFLPEFLGRLSGVIEFNALTREHCKLILGKILTEFNETKLARRNLSLKLSEAMENHLLDKGFNPTYGARPVKNFFNEEVLSKLADRILDSQEKEEGVLIVDRVNEEIVFKNTLPAPVLTLDTEVPVVCLNAESLDKMSK